MKSEHGTLVASTVSTETLQNAAGDPNFTHVLVTNQGATGVIYFTVAAEGTAATPTVGGSDTYQLSAATPARSVPIGSNDRVQVKLISAGTEAYSVEAE